MFTPFCSADLLTVSLKDKRALLSQLKASIKNDVVLQKETRLSIKSSKEKAAKAKVLAAIKAAEIKLAKLNARLAA